MTNSLMCENCLFGRSTANLLALHMSKLSNVHYISEVLITLVTRFEMISFQGLLVGVILSHDRRQ